VFTKSCYAPKISENLHLNKSQNSSPYSEKPSTCAYYEEENLLHLLHIQFNIILPSTPRKSKRSLHSLFLNKTLCAFVSAPSMPHAPFISAALLHFASLVCIYIHHVNLLVIPFSLLLSCFIHVGPSTFSTACVRKSLP
jgi:hypothetical protein